MATIIIDLDHVEKGIKNFEKYVHGVDEAIDGGLREILERTSEHMSMEASNYGLSESDLEKTKYIDFAEDEVEVGYASEHAQYVEYGTGIIGSYEQHPEADDIGWEYDINGHDIRGWYYLGKDMKVHWTLGMPARPIVYNTKRWLKTQATRILRRKIRSIKV